MKIQVQAILTAFLLFCSLSHFAQSKEVGGKRGKSQQVIVRGFVVKPGVMEYKVKTTIFAVIFAAGGETQFGSLKRVKVIRDGKELQFDLTNVNVKNKELAEPGDTIEVPEKNMFGK